VLGQFNARRGQVSGARLLAALVLISAVAGVVMSRGAANAQDDTTIRFAFWGDPAEQAAYEQVIAGFEAGHPDIQVEIDYTPGQSDYYRKMTTDFAAGQPPDLFLINYRNVGPYIASGSLEPAETYLANSDELTAEDYAPVSMAAFQSGGQQICMPQNVSSLVVYYNEDLFAANGVPLPQAGWTWDEFTAAAQALTQDTDGDGVTDIYGVAVEPVMYRMVPFVWSAGGEVVDDLDNPTTLTLDSPEALDGLNKIVSLGVNGLNVVPSAEEVAAEEDQDRFMRGGAAMFLQSRRPVPTLREIEGFTWDVAPLPIINEAATVLHSDAFCMASAAEDKEAVWEFVEYAAGEEGQLVLAETGRIVPVLNSVAESDVFLSGAPIADGEAPAAGLPPASSRVFIDNIPAIHRLPTISTWTEVEDAFNAEFDQAFYEPIDIPAAVQTVTENTVPIFERAAEAAAQ
jgi:multiple sugar transport system substrate-binding protein